MLGVTDLSTYLIGLVAIILLPGPNSMYVLSVATRLGVRPAYAAAAGVFIGDSVLMVLSAAGAASALRANPTLFMVVKYGGAVYLAWLAVGLLRAAWTKWRSRHVPVESTSRSLAPSRDVSGSAGVGSGAAELSLRERPFARAIVVGILNPKAALFFLAFFVQFVDPTYPRPWLSFLFLGALVQVVSLTYLSVLIFGGSTLAKALGRHRWVAATGTAGVGLLFLGFAAKLALARL